MSERRIHPEVDGSIDLRAVRSGFPALSPEPGDGIVHADAPGGTQVLGSVIEAMADHLRSANANAHGTFPTSQRTDAMCDEIREDIAGFLGSSPDGIVFGPNMTTLTFHVARAVARGLEPGQSVVTTELDHDANVSPWRAAADLAGAEHRSVPLTADGVPEVGVLDDLVDDSTAVVAFPAASNAFGTIVDPEPFVAAAARVGALSFCDAVHAAPHVRLDRTAAGIDALVCSPYKFFGPHAGILAADPELLADLEPDRVRPAPDAGPERWQTGTADFEAIAGTGAAVRYLRRIGMGAVAAYENELSRRFLEGLRILDTVTLHGSGVPEDRTPTFAVTVDGVAPDEVARRLAARDIYVWAGHYYAVEPMRALGLLDRGGAVRIGFVHYHGHPDVERVLDALEEIRP